MPSDFDARLHDLLEDAAREIPPDATVIPGLLHQIAVDTRVRRSPLRQSYRFIAPLIAVIIVVAIAFTFVAFHTTQHRGVATVLATATATATLAPSASFTPSTISAHGLTVQLDSVDANAFRIAVGYHVVTPVPHQGVEYDAPPNLFLVDDQGSLHYSVGNDISFPDGLTGTPYHTAYFAPLAPAPAASHTLTFSIPTITAGGAEGDPYLATVNGPWSFTLHVTPAMSGTKALAVPGQTFGGISVVPQAMAWVNDSQPINSQGVNLQLRVSGFPKVSDPLNHPAGFYMTTYYKGDLDGGGDPSGPFYTSPYSIVTLTLPGGKVVKLPAYFNIAGNHFDPNHANAEEYLNGSISADGSAIIDLGFQGVTLTPGETVQLTIANIGFISSTRPTSYVGPWTFTLTM